MSKVNRCKNCGNCEYEEFRRTIYNTEKRYYCGLKKINGMNFGKKIGFGNRVGFNDIACMDFSSKEG